MKQQKIHLKPLPVVHDGMTPAKARAVERQKQKKLRWNEVWAFQMGRVGAAFYAIPSRRALSRDRLQSDPSVVEPVVTSQPFSATPLSFSELPNQAERERKARWWSSLCC